MWIRRPNAGHCAAVGEALARLHLAGADFPMQRANALSVDRLAAALSSRPSDARRQRAAGPVRRDRATSSTRWKRSWPRDLPQGVIHADLFPDNVFFLGDRLSGLIDFYFACTDTLAYDVAICLNAWCFEPDHSYNVTKGRALLQAYAQGAPAVGRRARGAAAAGARRGHALPADAAGRLADVPPGALVRPKDPLEYFRKLRFHQSVKSVRDYGIDGMSVTQRVIDPHRRRLLGQSGAGRLGRDPARSATTRRSSRAASRTPPTTAWN